MHRNGRLKVVKSILRSFLLLIFRQGNGRVKSMGITCLYKINKQAEHI